VGSIAELEVLKSKMVEHGIYVAVYESDNPTRSDQDFFSGAMLPAQIVHLAPEKADSYTTSAGNSKYVMRDVQGELPSEALLWPGHLHRRRTLVPLASA
jgi:hypothetical protein